MSFTYYSGVPASGNDPSDDQPLMLTNSQSIDGILNVDHFSFGAQGPADGRHKQVSMRNQSSPALPNTFDGVFYCNNDFPLWKNPASASSGTDYNVATYVGTPTAATQGTSFLPGGIRIIWSSQTLDNDGNSIRNDSPFVFPFGGFTSTCYTVLFNAEKSSRGAEGLWIKNGTLTNTGFSITTSASNGQLSPFYYVAIGD